MLRDPMPDPLSSFSFFLLLLIFWVVKMFLLPGLKANW